MMMRVKRPPAMEEKNSSKYLKINIEEEAEPEVGTKWEKAWTEVE